MVLQITTQLIVLYFNFTKFAWNSPDIHLKRISLIFKRWKIYFTCIFLWTQVFHLKMISRCPFLSWHFFMQISNHITSKFIAFFQSIQLIHQTYESKSSLFKPKPKFLQLKLYQSLLCLMQAVPYLQEFSHQEGKGGLYCADDHGTDTAHCYVQPLGWVHLHDLTEGGQGNVSLCLFLGWKKICLKGYMVNKERERVVKERGR